MSKKIMFFKMILNSFIKRRSRMVIALLAIGIGAIIISGLMTIYKDIPRQMSKEFRSYGANIIFIPKDSEKKITEEIMENVYNEIPKDKLVGFAPFKYQSIKINEQPFIAAATNIEEAKKNSPYWLIYGEWPQSPSEVLIGNNIAKSTKLKEGDSFEIVLSQGESLSLSERKIIQRTYIVSGIVLTGGAEESFVLMSFDDLDRLTPQKINIDVIECSIDGNEEALKIISNNIKENVEGVVPRLAQRLTQSQDIVLSKLQSLVWIVTIIVLMLTMISVSTTMMAVVTERKKEIALKKSLGASDFEIILEFMGEGLILGLFGGIIGVIFGFFFAQKISISVFARNVTFNWELVPITIILSLVITMLACAIPVRKTVDVEPAIVLKGE